jgi:hypothetical protein
MLSRLELFPNVAAMVAPLLAGADQAKARKSAKVLGAVDKFEKNAGKFHEKNWREKMPPKVAGDFDILNLQGRVRNIHRSKSRGSPVRELPGLPEGKW